ncbi:peptidase dimerization domain-containing protein [Sphingomonas sp. I4]
MTVTGHEAHSSLIHLGASANMVAIRLMQQLADLADRLAGRVIRTDPSVRIMRR